LNRIGIWPDGGDPNCIGGTVAGAGAVVAAGEGIAVAGAGIAVAAGDGAAVACAIALVPVFPHDASADGAATAVSPNAAIKLAVRTAVLSRFNVAS